MTSPENSPGSVLARTGLTILIVLLMVAVGIPISNAIWEIAARQCPGDTFASGKLYFSWDGWAVAAFAVTLFLSVMSVAVRFPPFTEQDREKYSWCRSRIGIGTLVLLVVTVGVGLWLTNSTPICLASSGVYHRTAPWRTFRRQAWADAVRLNVECRYRRRQPDLHYVITWKDGTKLDIADALGRRTFYRFRDRLAHVPYAFAANVAGSCPDWYSDWVGTRP
jgi:hypothetical protein